MDKKNEKLVFISYLRATSVIFILLCHYTNMSQNSYVHMSAQFFNVGNDIFFIISGFCFGMQNFRSGKIKDWYKKRIRRIFIPYEVMLAALLIVTIARGGDIDIMDWGRQIIGMQGWHGVHGAGHTWFITSLLLCYLITPLLDIIIEEIKSINLIICFIVFPIVITYGLSNIFEEPTLIIPICWYSIAFILGKNYLLFTINSKKCIAALGIMVISILVRLFARMILDGTVVYNVIISGYTHAVLAFGMLFLFAYMFRNCKEILGVKYLNKLSYEIYLWHYMFVGGPISLFGKTTCWITDCILVTVVSIIVAYGSNRIVARLVHV